MEPKTVRFLAAFGFVVVATFFILATSGTHSGWFTATYLALTPKSTAVAHSVPVPNFAVPTAEEGGSDEEGKRAAAAADPLLSQSFDFGTVGFKQTWKFTQFYKNTTTHSYKELKNSIVAVPNFDLDQVITGGNCAIAFSILCWLIALGLFALLCFLLCAHDARPSLSKAVLLVGTLLVMVFATFTWTIFLALFKENWDHERAALPGLNISSLDPSWSWVFAFLGWFFSWVVGFFVFYQSLWGAKPYSEIK